MSTKLLKHVEELHKIDNQRKGWLVLSAFVSAAVLGIIFGWNWVNEHHLVWIMVSSGLVLAVVWWYWTMRLIRHLVQYKVTESEILTDIVKDIQYIRNKIEEPIDK